MKWSADPDMQPGATGSNVFNVRAYTAPIPARARSSFEFEYASERNGDALDSNAWTLQGAYEFSAVGWTPKLSYRYAFFQGDDPGDRRRTRRSIRSSSGSPTGAPGGRAKSRANTSCRTPTSSRIWSARTSSRRARSAAA